MLVTLKLDGDWWGSTFFLLTHFCQPLSYACSCSRTQWLPSASHLQWLRTHLAAAHGHWTLDRWTLSYHPSLNTHQVNVLGALLEVAREWGCLTMVVSPITTPEQCCSKQAGKIDLVQREVQKLALWILRHNVPLKHFSVFMWAFLTDESLWQSYHFACISGWVHETEGLFSPP